MKKKRNKKGVIPAYLTWFLIALGILVLLMLAIFILKGTGFEWIEKVKNIFRGR